VSWNYPRYARGSLRWWTPLSKYLTGYQPGIAVDEPAVGDPIGHGDIHVSVRSEPSDTNKAITAVGIWAASLWYNPPITGMNDILYKIDTWALAGVLAATLVDALFAEFVGDAGVAALA